MREGGRGGGEKGRERGVRGNLIIRKSKEMRIFVCENI